MPCKINHLKPFLIKPFCIKSSKTPYATFCKMIFPYLLSGIRSCTILCVFVPILCVCVAILLRNSVRIVILQACRGYRRARRGFFFLKNRTCFRNIVYFVILQACRGYRRARRGFFFLKNKTFYRNLVYFMILQACRGYRRARRSFFS